MYTSETEKALELNIGRGGMKRLMEEAMARHAKAVNYVASTGIRVGGNEGQKAKYAGFWPLVLEGFSGVQLKKEEVERA